MQLAWLARGVARCTRVGSWKWKLRLLGGVGAKIFNVIVSKSWLRDDVSVSQTSNDSIERDTKTTGSGEPPAVSPKEVKLDSST